MTGRTDVRGALLAVGWAGDGPALAKGGATWAAAGEDCFLTGPNRRGRGQMWTVDFGGDVPASVIVAAAEATAAVSVDVASGVEGSVHG